MNHVQAFVTLLLIAATPAFGQEDSSSSGFFPVEGGWGARPVEAGSFFGEGSDPTTPTPTESIAEPTTSSDGDVTPPSTATPTASTPTVVANPQLSAMERCIAGFNNGACVASPSAKAETETLFGSDLVDLVEYQQDGWAKTSVASMSKDVAAIGSAADTVGTFHGLASNMATKGVMTANAEYMKKKVEAASAKGVVAGQADGLPTFVTPAATTTIEIGPDGLPFANTNIPKQDRGAAAATVGVEALTDAQIVGSAVVKSPWISVPVVSGKYLKWMTNPETGSGAGNVVQASMNAEDVKRAKEFNAAMKKVQANDPEWFNRTTMPAEIQSVVSDNQTAYSRQPGTLVEKMYWQAWAAKRQYQGQ